MPDLWNQFSNAQLSALYPRMTLDRKIDIDTERMRRELYPQYAAGTRSPWEAAIEAASRENGNE